MAIQKFYMRMISASRFGCFLWSLQWTLAVLCGMSTSLQGSNASERPNVLFIAVDDMRCELGCYGSPHVHSPNIDRFAASGVLFHRAYCQQAVCNPSRVSLLTGMRPDSTRVWDLVTEMRSVNPNALTLPQHFRQHGYHAVAYGKIFHNSFPDVESWDEPTHNAQGVVAFSEANRLKLAQFKESMRARGKPETAIEKMRGPAIEIQNEPDDRNFDGKQTSDAIVRLQELAAADQPFFLAVGYIRPHLPFITPKPYWDLYDRGALPLAKNPRFPRNAPKVSFGDRSMGGYYELRGYMDYADAPSIFDQPLTESQQRELKHGYYASVSFVDTQIGRLLTALDSNGLAQNTIIVLWSDHGWKLGEHGGWCKQTNYEWDTHVPLIVRAPNARSQGQASYSIVEFVDIFPTLCELAALPVPAHLEGKSFRSILDDVQVRTKDCAFSQFPRKHESKDYMGYAMRTDQYRYVEWLDAVTGDVTARELYDHHVDPDENENVAESPEKQVVVPGLSAKMWKTLERPTFPLSIAQQRKVEKSDDVPATEKPGRLEWQVAIPANPLPASRPKGDFQSVTFINQKLDPVDVVWMGPDGSEKVYHTLEPQGEYRIRTRPGITWCIRTKAGQQLGHFVVAEHPSKRSDAIIPK